MSIEGQFKILFSYHFDTLERFLEIAARLDQEDYFAESGYGRGSLHGLLFHVLVSDNLWRGGLESGSRPAALEQENFQNLESLRRLLAEEREAWEKFLAETSLEELESDLALRSRVAGELELPRWWFLQHVTLHGMQHFAEIAQRLTELGHSPGNIDFIYYQADV